jgi:hypothetical protein
MTKFVMAVLVIQVIGGLYQFMVLATARSEHSTARATRLPDWVVFTHAALGFLAAGVWVGQLVTGNDLFAWTTLGLLLMSVVGGTVLFLKTELRSETLDRPAMDPADVRVVEKQIPKSVIHGHGLGAAVLVVCVLVVAL